jgi:hypothetical protein
MMSAFGKFALFIETPRAGEHGHRILVGTRQKGLDPSIAVNFLRMLDKDDSVGENFVGVSRTVKQVCGTAVREGREIIVLAGVDATKISTTDLEDLKKWLEEKLDQFENSVLSKTAWSQLSDRNVLIEEAVLGEWLEEIDQERKLPHTDWCSGPRPRSGAPQASLSEQNSPRSRGERWSRRPLTLLVCLLLTCLLFGSVGILPPSLIAQPNSSWWERIYTFRDSLYNSVFSSFGNRSKPDTAADPNYKRSDSKQEPCNLKGHITKLAEEWHCTELAVVHSLLRASNWDRRHLAEKMEDIEQFLNDGDVKIFLQEIMGKESPDRFFMSREVQSNQDFRDFVQHDVLHNSDDVRKYRDFREWLYSTWERWNDFKEEVERTENFRSTSADASHKMLEMLAKIPQEEGFGDGFCFPMTPLFDRQDTMIWDFLKQIPTVLKKLDLISSEELAKSLKEIRERHEQIIDKVHRRRDEFLVRIPKPQEKEVRNAFTKLELFIDQLAKFSMIID